MLPILDGQILDMFLVEGWPLLFKLSLGVLLEMRPLLEVCFVSLPVFFHCTKERGPFWYVRVFVGFVWLFLSMLFLLLLLFLLFCFCYPIKIIC